MGSGEKGKKCRRRKEDGEEKHSGKLGSSYQRIKVMILNFSWDYMNYEKIFMVKRNIRN